MAEAPANAGAIPAREAGDAVRGAPVTPQQLNAAEGRRETTEAAGAPESSGLPQFQFQHWAGQIIWLVVLFGLLYLLLARVFVPRLRGVRDQRDAAIDGAIAEARRVQAEADAQAQAAQAEMAGARAKAQAAASDAKARANAEATARQHAQEAELNARLAEAETRIRASRDSAMASVREVAADTAAAIVERLTGRAPATGEVDAALPAQN